MVTSLKEQALKRQPVYRNIHITQITSYRLPAPAWVSIMHRVSGALMFLLLPFVIWMFDASLTSEISYQQFVNLFAFGGMGLPAFVVKLVVLALIWAYLMHFIAGLRHVWMDVTHDLGLAFGRASAIFTIGLSSVLTVALGVKLFL